jgi:uncharacterized protein with HEPN domain
MKQPLNDRTRLEHMLEAADEVLAQYALLPNGRLPDGDFRYYAFVKCVEIIGEAAYRLSRDFRKQQAEVEWAKVIRLRHILVHEYHSVNEDTIFHIIKTHVPVLRNWVANYLATNPEA